MIAVALQKLIKDDIVLRGDAIVLISAVNRILLHLSEGVALENVAKELIMGFFETFKVVH